MPHRLIIFDFDGTIADTHRYMVSITNLLADEFKFKKIPDHEISQLKDKSARQMVYKLGVPLWKIPKILARGKKKFYEGMVQIKPFDGWHDVLKNLKQNHFQLGILSSNSSENIRKFLTHHKLEFFDFIHTTPRIWSKHTSLLKILREHHVEKKDLLYIGDETRDIEAAKKAGIPIAAVTWGYNSQKLLKEHNPDFLIDQPQKLLALFAKK